MPSSANPAPTKWKTESSLKWSVSAFLWLLGNGGMGGISLINGQGHLPVSNLAAQSKTLRSFLNPVCVRSFPEILIAPALVGSAGKHGLDKTISLHLHGMQDFMVRIFFQQNSTRPLFAENVSSPEFVMLVNVNCTLRSANITWLCPHVPPASLTKVLPFNCPR